MSQVPVSVVIPAYNRAALVGRAISGVQRQQGLSVAEIIVVDDGSADDTAEVARSLGARVVVHERNRGLPAGRNTGMRAATQEWVAYLDSDDEWLPHLLTTLWPLRDGHTLVGGAGLARAAEPEDDYFAGTWTRRPRVLRSPAPLLAAGTFIGPSSVLVRRDALLATGGSDETLPRVGGAEDLDLWCRLLGDGRTAIVTPQPVTLYHRTGEGAAEVQDDKMGQLAAFERIAHRHAHRRWASQRLLDRAHGLAEWDRLRAATRAGDRAAARRHGAELARRPWAAFGAADQVLRRRRLARRRWVMTHEGVQTVAVLPGVDASACAGCDPEAIVDLRGASSARAMATIVRRPPGEARVHTVPQALAAWVAGVRSSRW